MRACARAAAGGGSAGETVAALGIGISASLDEDFGHVKVVVFAGGKERREAVDHARHVHLPAGCVSETPRLLCLIDLACCVSSTLPAGAQTPCTHASSVWETFGCSVSGTMHTRCLSMHAYKVPEKPLPMCAYKVPGKPWHPVSQNPSRRRCLSFKASTPG